MGSKLSVCEEHGYMIQCNTEDGTVATSKEGKEVVIKGIKKPCQEIASDVDKLKATIHPHIVGYNSFEVEDCLYIVMDHCKGGNLAQKIQEQRESGGGFDEDQILQWIVQTCMALECIHGNGLLHKDLKPEGILLTESGTVRLGGFGRLSERMHGKTISSPNAAICYTSPEMSTYGTKSDVWALGCVLYELCTLELAFTAGTEFNQRAADEYPTLPGHFSRHLQQLLNDIFQRDPASRPTARAILTRPFITNFLIRKSKATIEELQANLGLLAALADGLEKVHESTTIGSLTGNITGAVGSLTSIVGLSLALTTLGLSLIVTGVGVIVSVAGGAAASISNITNKVKKNNVHQAIGSIIKRFTEKLNSVVTSLAHISQGPGQLPEMADFPYSEGRKRVREMAKKAAMIGAEAVNCLGGIPQLVDLIEAGGTAAEMANVVQAVDMATGVLSSLAVAVDVFFIAKDAKEIHDIRQAQAAAGDGTHSEGETLIDADPESVNIKSKTMKFVLFIRQKARELQEIVDQLEETVDGCFRSVVYND